LGGADNLLSIDACTTRLRLHLADRNKAIDSELKALGAMAIVRPGNAGSLQVVVGPMADSLADELRIALPSAGVLPTMPTATQITSETAPITATEAQQWLAALGGDQVMQVDCVAHTRLRVRLDADQQMAENRLNALGCLGLSPLEAGVWHVLVGNRARGLSEAIKPMLVRG
jgi:PTS system N-acetylglucosamine-specific IIC component